MPVRNPGFPFVSIQKTPRAFPHWIHYALVIIAEAVYFSIDELVYEQMRRIYSRFINVSVGAASEAGVCILHSLRGNHHGYNFRIALQRQRRVE
jgi:hypothetical protein